MCVCVLKIELKNLPYFNGIDWDAIYGRKCQPPFEPTEFEFDERNPIDLVARLNIDVNEKLDEAVLKRLCSKLDKIEMFILYSMDR